MQENNCSLLWMMSALGHKYQSAQIQVVCMLSRTFRLEKSLSEKLLNVKHYDSYLSMLLGEIFSSLFVGDQFIMYTAVATASPQYSFGKCLASNMLHAISMMVMFFLSATSFCWGVYHAMNFFCMPWVLQKFRNSFETYSPPLLVLNILMRCPLWFSTIALNC